MNDLCSRRNQVTGVVLAGGQSSRMGMSKAELSLMGKSLLEWQVNKLKKMGVAEVLISGPPTLKLPGTHTVSDIYPRRGPLSGLHACLTFAQTPFCLVVTVDMPFTPPYILAQLYHCHGGGVTLLTHNGKWEPLLAVYDSSLAGKITPLIENNSAPVRDLLRLSSIKTIEYQGPKEYILNCNMPSEYKKAIQLATDPNFIAPIINNFN